MPEEYNKLELFRKKRGVILTTNKIIIFLLFSFLSYSTSFDMLKTKINEDNSYNIISNNDYDVRPIHRYRILIPKIYLLSDHLLRICIQLKKALIPRI